MKTKVKDEPEEFRTQLDQIAQNFFTASGSRSSAHPFGVTTKNESRLCAIPMHATHSATFLSSRPQFQTFADILGDPKRRYFSHGFRRVTHTLQVTSLGRSRSGDFEVKGIGGVVYPPDWSFSSDGSPREIHLSSIDAIVLLARAVEEAAEGLLPLSLFATARLEGLRLRAGSVPCTNLSAVPVEFTLSLGQPNTAEVHAVIGGFKLEAELVCSEHRVADGADYRPYAHGYLATELDSTVEAWEPASRTISTSHELYAPTIDRDRLTGLDSDLWPVITHVGNLLLFGQMAQILVFFATGIGRGSSENLWVRRLELSRRPGMQRSHFTASARLLRHQMIDRDSLRHHSLLLEAQTDQGLAATASFGFIAPTSGDGSYTAAAGE